MEKWSDIWSEWEHYAEPRNWKQRVRKYEPNEGDICPEYNKYRLSLQEWGLYELEGIAACGAIAYLFYRNMAAFFLFLPIGILYPFYRKRERKKQRKEELRLQFKEAILILASSLGAGYSIENAFSESIRELKELYGTEGMITGEFAYISHQLQMNRTVEQLLMDFAVRSGLEEIQNFAEIFAVSKRSRGELTSVVKHAVHVISDKIQVREEIITLTAEKKLEQKIMNSMPFLIVLYIDLSSPGFFVPLYITIMGKIVMTVCLLVYLAACILSRRIMEIEV
ncbi:MAG: type II secretion system protein F [Clostridium sp.]